jgi:ABC-type uncharacterized transport system fused permease/ATPase subunit
MQSFAQRNLSLDTTILINIYAIIHIHIYISDTFLSMHLILQWRLPGNGVNSSTYGKPAYVYE